ncbi:MAG: hypothetical protein V1739_09610 [Candidatus Omnitrophota bacterium]
MTNENDQQAKDEETIFRKFLEQCPYHIQSDSIEKRQAPSPDILCKLSDGATICFELVECVDNSIAKSVYGGSLQGGFFSDDLCLERIAKKFGKKYSNGCDLLVYFDLQPVVAEESWLPQVQNFIRENIKNSSFKRVWIYSIPQEKIMFVYPEL